MKSVKPSTGLGFSLVEVTLALGIAAFCLLAIFGLLPVGLRTNQAATQEMTAVNLLSSIVADLRATPPTADNSALYSIPLPGDANFYLGEDGQSSPTLTDQSRYRCKVTSLLAPGNTATCLLISISWPPAVDPVTGTPVGKLDSYVAINR